jgi:hypothetical protein
MAYREMPIYIKQLTNTEISTDKTKVFAFEGKDVRRVATAVNSKVIK